MQGGDERAVAKDPGNARGAPCTAQSVLGRAASLAKATARRAPLEVSHNQPRPCIARIALVANYAQLAQTRTISCCRQIAKEKEFVEREEARKAAAAEFAGEPYHKEVCTSCYSC